MAPFKYTGCTSIAVECRAPQILVAEMSASTASDSILSVREWPFVHSITPKRRYRDTVHWSQKAPLLIDNGTL